MLNTIILISGTGRLLNHLAELTNKKELPLNIKLVISSRKNVRGIEIASQHNLPCLVYENSDDMNLIIDSFNPDLICMAGYAKFWRFPDKYIGKVMNIHPSLLPKFGGKGFYGNAVHRAVLDAGETESGVTVHYATNERYDEGEVIVQRKVDVMSDDTVESLSARVFEQELIAYPEAIQKFCNPV